MLLIGRGALTHEDMSEVHHREGGGKGPDLPKWHLGQPAVYYQADRAAGNAKYSYLKELQALSMEDLQCEERPCSTSPCLIETAIGQ